LFPEVSSYVEIGYDSCVSLQFLQKNPQTSKETVIKIMVVDGLKNVVTRLKTPDASLAAAT